MHDQESHLNYWFKDHACYGTSGGATFYPATKSCDMPVTDKKALRQQFKKRRSALPAYRQRLASYAIADKVLRRIPAMQRADTIAFYIAREGEIDLLPLMLHCLKQGRQCYLPVLEFPEENKLSFAGWVPGQPMSQNKYGIAEPVVPHHHLLAAADIDLIFMPTLAFDKDGNRLGMGGGYYDRTLADCFEDGTARSSQKPFLVATGHDVQYIPRLPRNTWDIVPHITISPGHFIRPPRLQDN